MADFLLELLSEEIPARMQVRAAEELKRLATVGLEGAGLTWTGIQAHVTPRRLVLMVEGLPLAQPEVEDERRGPRVDAPPAAIEGFLRANGVTLDQCERRDTPKGAMWFVVLRRGGRPTTEVLVGLTRRFLDELTWPKSMHWGSGTFRWVRPLHHVLALFDGKPLVGEVEPEPHRRWVFSALTFGHRFLAPAAFAVSSLEDYRSRLSAAHVMVDREQRKKTILTRARALAGAEGLTLRDDPELLEEVAGLVEWPVVLIGRIDDAFLDVPPEVLITAMRAHQRYFSLTRPDGSLAPRFIVVANTITVDGGRAVVAGNEKVLRARLSDAKFFWDHDRKVRLADRVPALKDVVFHAKLGSMEEKAVRLQTLAAHFAERIAGAEIGKARSAALLAKADLTTGMVGEFPELQGVMGRYYALHEGEDAEVADAIAQHYSPLGPSDACPTAPVAVAVALADKIDTLVGFFSIGEKPTGSRDPFALRRAALGVIRLIVENGLRLPLGTAIGQAEALYPAQRGGAGSAAAELLPFFADRLKVALREKGVRHDLIDAVFALGGEDDLVRLLARVAALGRFLATEDGADLLLAYRRAANIVRIEAKKDKRDGFGQPVEPARFAQDEETALYDALAAAHDGIAARLSAEDFEGAMTVLAGLRRPVDAFFDRVTVNAEDPALRHNRLALLSSIVAAMNEVAEFSKIEG